MRDAFLLMHFTGVIFGAGSGFAIFVIGFISARFRNEYRREVLFKLFPLRYISYLGLMMLITSGILLVQPFLPNIEQMPWLIGKLIFVALLTAFSIFGVYQMRRAKSDVQGNAFTLISLAGRLSFVASMLIVICAVYSFH